MALEISHLALNGKISRFVPCGSCESVSELPFLVMKDEGKGNAGKAHLTDHKRGNILQIPNKVKGSPESGRRQRGRVNCIESG